MYYSKLATVLSRKQQNRRFKAFSTCEIITIESSSERGVYNSLLLDITKYRFNFNSSDRATLNVLKMNNR